MQSEGFKPSLLINFSLSIVKSIKQKLLFFDSLINSYDKFEILYLFIICSPAQDIIDSLSIIFWLEKSYELAARYNGKEPDASSTTNAPNSRKERTAVRPVKRVQNRMVSSLAQPAGNEDIASGYAGERNTGFHTPVGKMPSSGRNTIAACVHGTQTVSDGQALRIRLLEPMAVDDLLIPKGTVLVGGTRVEGERMGILIETVEYRGTLFPVELEVYDADGQQGILVPNSMEYDAAREIAAGMGTSIGSSINISTDAGAQIASDVGKGVIRGVSQYVGKKMRTVKITLKAGHRLLLHSPEK